MAADVAVKELEGMRESEAVTAAMREAEFERVQREGVETSLADLQVRAMRCQVLNSPLCVRACTLSLHVCVQATCVRACVRVCGCTRTG